MTVTLYLDSADYSRLSDPRNATDPRLEDYRRRLRLLAKRGVAIPFSLTHLEELLRNFETHPDLAARKAELIEELSGGFCFPDVSELVSIEAEQLLAGRAPTILLRKNWRWLPFDSLGLPDTRKEFRDQYSQISQQFAMNRKARRAAGVDMGGVAEQLSKRFASDALENELGVSDGRLERALRAYVRGSSGRRALEQEFIRALGRPTSFLKFYADKIAAEHNFLGRVLGSGRKLSEAYRKLFERMNDAESHPELHTRAAEIVRESIDVSADWLLSATVRDIVVATEIIEKARTAKLGFGALSLEAVVAEHIRLHATFARNRRNPSNSDVGDVLHAMYVGYVNIWRGDKFSAPLVKRALPHFSDRVFGSLEEAIDAAELLVA